MPASMPKVSVVTPSFNQAQFIIGCLNSVAQQNYPNSEHLVLDGGSGDGSPRLIKQYEHQLAYYRSSTDAGQASAINDGLARATGDILCWINSDDGLLPNALTQVAKRLPIDRPAWLAGHSIARNGKGKNIRKRRVSEVFLGTFLRYTELWLPQPSVFWNRKMQEEIGLLDESLHYVMDLDFFFRMFRLSDPILVDVPLSFFTVHPNAKTAADPSLVDREYRNWIKERIALGELSGDAVLDDFIYLQRCHRTMSEHFVISRIARFWKRQINPQLYI